jgi:hypothetical protein
VNFVIRLDEVVVRVGLEFKSMGQGWLTELLVLSSWLVMI